MYLNLTPKIKINILRENSKSENGRFIISLREVSIFEKLREKQPEYLQDANATFSMDF